MPHDTSTTGMICPCHSKTNKPIHLIVLKDPLIVDDALVVVVPTNTAIEIIGSV